MPKLPMCTSFTQMQSLALVEAANRLFTPLTASTNTESVRNRCYLITLQSTSSATNRKPVLATSLQNLELATQSHLSAYHLTTVPHRLPFSDCCTAWTACASTAANYRNSHSLTPPLSSGHEHGLSSWSTSRSLAHWPGYWDWEYPN